MGANVLYLAGAGEPVALRIDGRLIPMLSRDDGATVTVGENQVPRVHVALLAPDITFEYVEASEEVEALQSEVLARGGDTK